MKMLINHLKLKSMNKINKFKIGRRFLAIRRINAYTFYYNEPKDNNL